MLPSPACNLTALRLVAAETGGVFIQGDLRDPGCPRHTVEVAVDALGGLDVMVSNAGIGWAGAFASMTESDIDSLLDVNLRAAAHLAGPRTPPAARRRPVFVGSIAGRVGVPGEAWYSATKAGLDLPRGHAAAGAAAEPDRGEPGDAGGG